MDEGQAPVSLKPSSEHASQGGECSTCYYRIVVITPARQVGYRSSILRSSATFLLTNQSRSGIV